MAKLIFCHRKSHGWMHLVRASTTTAFDDKRSPIVHGSIWRLKPPRSR
jgi:hypothetical protein